MGLGLSGYAAPNPVLPGVADAGVIRFNGAYYLMGVGTDGAFWRSRDLKNWDGPHHAFSMDNDWATGDAGKDREIHACDIALHNGTFHLYWSVNYRLLRAIGRAVSDSILGPYVEPEREHPFDGRIDPHLFVDDDGSCYFYTVKFTDGNVIYGQPMAGPDRLIGDAKPLLSAVPDTWEFMDHKVNEAPCVVRYRGLYYMLYNGNHTGLEYGNYAIGCAVADDPLGFSNDGKYPYYLLRDNWRRIGEHASVLSPLSRDEGVLWKYMTDAPDETWHHPAYEDDDWLEAPGPFGNPDLFMLGGAIRTHWDTDNVRLRRSFVLDEVPEDGDLYVLINHDADAEVFFNGVSACRVTGFSGGYALHPVSASARTALRRGDNLMAVHCAHDGRGAQYIDAGLYLFQPGTAEPVIFNCGQPNLVRGPNGFEWWLVYFAVYNGDPQRGQAVDRVHFLDRELYVEGPTSGATPGAWQLPAAPTFSDHFDGDHLSDPWQTGSGDWRLEDGCLGQLDPEGLHRNHIQLPVHTHYLFETGFRFLGEEGSQVGIIAWERAPEQALYIGFDRKENTWFWVHRHEFVVRSEVFHLPDQFNWDGWHAVRIEKNESHFKLYINNIPAPGNPVILLPDAGAGRAGLVTRNSAAAFDGVVFTAGWDEHGEDIRGWGDGVDGTPRTGVWGSGAQGLVVEPTNGEARSFKGDLLQDFEWSVQVVPDRPEANAEFGAYACYQDIRNHVRVSLDAAMAHLIVTERWQGVALPDRVIPVRLREDRLQPPEESGINLRFVRAGEALSIYADGREAVTLHGAWPPAQVGLFAQNTVCRFNGITLYERGGDGGSD